MAYIEPDVLAEIKKMDLLTYLMNYEPQELKRISDHIYTTRTHDSLKISNGKWMWWSRGIGGKSALDYLIKVQGLDFLEAAEKILGKTAKQSQRLIPAEKKTERRLLLPPKNHNTDQVTAYLKTRGVDLELTGYCIGSGRLYESADYHNAVFVGMDAAGIPRYGCMRSTRTDFLGDVNGSDKRYSFCIPAEKESDLVHLFESAIDLLSYGTLQKLCGKDWRTQHLLSLSGVYQPAKQIEESKVPAALATFLEMHREVKIIALHLDNDHAGRRMVQALKAALPSHYLIRDRPPPQGKDCNDYLCLKLGRQVTMRIKKNREAKQER